MSTRTQLMAGVVVAGIAALIAAPHADAQTKTKSVPKTAWGDPDITGAYAEFTTAPLERPAELASQETTRCPSGSTESSGLFDPALPA